MSNYLVILPDRWGRMTAVQTSDPYGTINERQSQGLLRMSDIVDGWVRIVSAVGFDEPLLEDKVVGMAGFRAKEAKREAKKAR